MSNEHKKKKACNCKAQQQYDETREFLRYYGGVEAELGTEPKWKTYGRYTIVLLITLVLAPFLFIYVICNLTYNIISGNGKMISANPILKLLKTDE